VGATLILNKDIAMPHHFYAVVQSKGKPLTACTIGAGAHFMKNIYCNFFRDDRNTDRMIVAG
jgi:hypothetical protein